MVAGSHIKPWLREAPGSYLFTNANIVDVESGTIIKNSSVVITDGRITSISPSETPDPPPVGHVVVDCQGRYLCPGLFDAHVHLVAVPGFNDLSTAFGNFNDVSLLRQPYVAAQMLGRRFGGHGDIRGSHDHTQCCGGHTNGLGRLCNGVPECMAAVREEIRCGADFIKIMGSGGVSTPTDKLEHLQFTPSEIQAMVECAGNAGTFVTAHAYTPEAIRHCTNNGVRGIEHGNFVDEATARLMAEKGVYLTPTLITYSEMGSEKWKGYLPSDGQAKNSEVLKSGLHGLKIASDAGVDICFGTDLLGPLGSAQTSEFTLRSKVLPPLAVLQSATVTPAKMMGAEHSIGQIKEGFLADVLLLDKNPLEDVTIFDDPEKYVLGVMKEGRVYKSRWDGLKEDAEIPVRIKAAL